MSANVETMFSVREKPWHGLGTIVQEAPTSADALKLAGLDWTVEKKPIFCEGVEIPNYKANVRSSDNSVLGIVTDRYSIVQNKDAFEFTDALIGGEVHYETAGSLRNGKLIWLLAKMPTAKVLGDDVEPYLCFSNSHDGTGAVKVAMTPVRVVCNNTLNFALKGAKRSWSVKHLGNIENKMDEAMKTLELAERYMLKLNEDADKLANSKITMDEVREIVKKMYPIEDGATERVKKNAIAAREGIVACYFAPDIYKFIGTKYGFINAVADYVDHSEPFRVTKNSKDNQFENIVNGHEMLDMAYSLVTAK